MTEHSPFTPPPELVKQWMSKFYGSPATPGELALLIAARSAQWGADQELEACRMEIIDGAGLFYIDETNDRVLLADELRAVRRPKPPSLKEQALAVLDPSKTYGSITQKEEYRISVTKAEIIRRALEALPDD